MSKQLRWPYLKTDVYKSVKISRQVEGSNFLPKDNDGFNDSHQIDQSSISHLKLYDFWRRQKKIAGFLS